MNSFNYLQHDFAIDILNYIDTETKLILCLICKQWKRIIERLFTDKDLDYFIRYRININYDNYDHSGKYKQLFNRFKPKKSITLYSELINPILSIYNYIESICLISFIKIIDFKILSSLPNLRILRLDYFNVDLSYFPQLKKVIELYIRSIDYFSNHPLSCELFPNLKKLTINSYSRNYSWLSILPNSIEEINVRNSFNDELLNRLSKFSNLNILKCYKIDKCNVYPSISIEFMNLKYLHTVEIESLKNIETLKYFPITIKILSFYIYGNDHKTDFSILSRFPQLEKLSISFDNEIKQSYIQSLGSLTKLKTLKLYGIDFEKDYNICFPKMKLDELFLEFETEQFNENNIFKEIEYCNLLYISHYIPYLKEYGNKINTLKLKYIEEISRCDYDMLFKFKNVIFEGCNFIKEDESLFKRCNHFYFINCF